MLSGKGGGAILLASGDWTIATGLTFSGAYLALFGMGRQTRLHVAAGAALSARVERVRDEVDELDGGEHGGFDL